jgi:hypothetical protein
MFFIVDFPLQWIAKHILGIFKAHAVLVNIGSVFLFMPLKAYRFSLPSTISNMPRIVKNPRRRPSHKKKHRTSQTSRTNAFVWFVLFGVVSNPLRLCGALYVYLPPSRRVAVTNPLRLRVSAGCLLRRRCGAIGGYRDVVVALGVR